MIPFAIALGVAPLLRWKKQEADLRPLFIQLAVSAVVSIILAVALPAIFADKIKIVAVGGFALAFWVIITSSIEVYIRATHRHSFASGVTKLGRSHWAMVLGHVGLAMMLIGISATQNYKIEKDIRMVQGDEVVLLITYSNSNVLVKPMARTTKVIKRYLISVKMVSLKLPCTQKNVAISHSAVCQ